MPSVSEYLSGFDLKKGLRVAGYELVDVETDHILVERYRLYDYPTTMIWRPVGGDRQEFLSELRSLLSETKTIYTRYGNPYDCGFGRLLVTGGEVLTVNAVGVCRRV